MPDNDQERREDDGREELERRGEEQGKRGGRKA
jgi:hypothetical protein